MLIKVCFILVEWFIVTICKIYINFETSSSGCRYIGQNSNLEVLNLCVFVGTLDRTVTWKYLTSVVVGTLDRTVTWKYSICVWL